jgi:hypothetical protein
MTITCVFVSLRVHSVRSFEKEYIKFSLSASTLSVSSGRFVVIAIGLGSSNLKVAPVVVGGCDAVQQACCC